MSITESTRFRARPRHLWQDLGDESVILDLDAGTYYGLNAVGSRIWNLIQTPRTVAEVCEALLAEFDVDRERCQRDVFTLLGALESRGMIEIDRDVR